jgi:DNA-binding SARP family transcriptional activator
MTTRDPNTGTSLRLQIIGPLRLFRSDELVPVPVPRGRASTLLALLVAHRDHLVGLDEIAATLWPPVGTPNAQQIVASLVSRLRRAVGPALQHIDGGYRLSTRGWTVDLDDAERLIGVAEHHLAADESGLAHLAAKRATQILDLGRPLEDQPGLAAADDLRVSTDALIRRARRAAWTSALALHDAESASIAAAAAALTNPLDEPAQRALMQAQYELGEPNAALRTYSALQRELRRELGTDPDPETQRVHLCVLRGEPGHWQAVSQSASSHGRPRPALSETRAVTLVGRDEVLAELRRAWRDAALGSQDSVLLLGGVGTGKSELLRTLARDVSGAGGAVLSTRCTPYDRTVPLHPLTDAIRRFCAAEHHDLVRTAAKGIEQPLAELVPPLADVLGIAERDPHSVHVHRLLHSIHTFLLSLSTHQPVLLAIDDAHLADDETIGVLHRLCASGTRRILVAVTAAEGNAGAMIGALGESSRQVRLGPLSAEDVTALARRWHVAHAAPQVYTLTGGLPRLVVEALRAVADGAPVDQLGQPLPVLHDAVLDHLRRAGDEAIELMTVAAALGSRFRFDELVRMGLPPAEAITGTQRALQTGLLEADGDTLAFVSELVHLVVLNSVPEPIRCALARCLPNADGSQPRGPSVGGSAGSALQDLDELEPAS